MACQKMDLIESLQMSLGILLHFSNLLKKYRIHFPNVLHTASWG